MTFCIILFVVFIVPVNCDIVT